MQKDGFLPYPPVCLLSDLQNLYIYQKRMMKTALCFYQVSLKQDRYHPADANAGYLHQADASEEPVSACVDTHLSASADQCYIPAEKRLCIFESSILYLLFQTIL